MSIANTEPVYCDTSDNQWTQESSPNVPQTVTESDIYVLPQNVMPASNGSPPMYHVPNGMTINGINGVNGVSFIPNTLNGPCDRNGAGLPNGILNGMRSLNIPNGVNGTNVMLRPNGHGINMVHNVNGYMNGALNPRYLPRPANWVTPAKAVNGSKKQKRNRTAFTSQQMMELEQEYARTRYLDRTRRIELSEILHLNERTIKIWFQNRRMKEKKDRAESLEDSEEVSTTESSPELGMSGTVPMPLLIHEQYPATVSNEEYNRGMYMEYQVSSTPAPMVPMPHGLPNAVAEYAEYISPEVYEAQCRQVHLQVQHYGPVPGYNELQPVNHAEAPTQPDSCSPAAPATTPEQNWDLSWIRSIHAEDEY